MIDQEQAEAAIQEYVRAEMAHDKAAWFALFAPDVEFEDPVGKRTFSGLEGLEQFWKGVSKLDLKIERTGPLIVCGNEAVAILRIEIGTATTPAVIEPVVSNYVFDSAGKITRMRAFYAS